jgi:dimethylargininase
MIKRGYLWDLIMATVRLDQKSRALTRAIPDSYHSALANYFGSGPTDIELARQQHNAYCKALEDAGLEVSILPEDEKHPDCIFVEDQAVIIDGHVLLPVPGHPSRVKEQPPIADFLIDKMGGAQICRMSGDARMDGGDILRLGDIFFVGRSSRTNDGGIKELEDLLDHLGYELRIIDIPEGALHLTSISSTPTDEIILAPEGMLPEDAFGELPEGSQVYWMPREETYGCNTIGLPGNKVLVAEGYPTVLNKLVELGLEPVILDVSQIRAGDGSLTCCSLFY